MFVLVQGVMESPGYGGMGGASGVPAPAQVPVTSFPSAAMTMLPPPLMGQVC